jgi:hypothetical protein
MWQNGIGSSHPKRAARKKQRSKAVFDGRQFGNGIHKNQQGDQNSYRQALNSCSSCTFMELL